MEKVAALRDMDLLLVHEWPRGLPQRAQERDVPPPGRTLPSYWIGNPITRRLVETVHPKWVLCGHSHRAFAVTLGGGGTRPQTRVACLDQAARPEESVFWMEFQGREVVCAGWGISGQVSWRAGQPWSLGVLPTPVGPEPLGTGY